MGAFSFVELRAPSSWRDAVSSVDYCSKWEVCMLEEVSRRRLFGWLAAAAIAVTAPASRPSQQRHRLSAWSVGNHDGKDGAWVGECGA